MDWKFQWRWRALVGLIFCFMILKTPAAGQTSQELKILVMDGSGSLNTALKETVKPISVRVLDRDNKPVPDATVVFALPEKGPGGDFPNGSNSMIAFTNPMGIAVAERYRANATTGNYQIQVRAAYMGQAATLSIRQTNVEAKKSIGKTIIIAAAAGGAAAAAFALKGGGGGGEPPSTPQTPPPVTPPTIVFGGSTVGPPR